MQTFAQIAHGIKWNYIYMMTAILTYTHSILGSPISALRYYSANCGNEIQPTEETKYGQLRK